MKLLKSLVLIPLLLLLVNTSIYAETVYTEGALNYIIKDGTICIVEYFGSDAEVTIPNVINNTPVTEIDNNAFVGSNAKKVIIPDSVTNVSSIIFDSGVTYEITDESQINEYEEPDNNTESEVNTEIDEEIIIEEGETVIIDSDDIAVIDSDVVETGDVDTDEEIVPVYDEEIIDTPTNNNLLSIVAIILLVGVISFYFVRINKNK